MPTRPTTGPDGVLLGIERRVDSAEREGLWTLPWGVVGVATRTDAGTTTSALRTVLTLTFVAVPGRWYDLRMRTRVAYGGGGEAFGLLTIAGTEVGRWFEFIATASGHISVERGVLWQFTGPATADVTVIATLESSGMTCSFQGAPQNPTQLSARDVGPAL